MALANVINDTKGAMKGLSNYMHAVSAVESGLEAKIGVLVTQATARQPGQVADYTALQTNARLRNAVTALIDQEYSFANPLNPLNGVVNATALGRNFYNQSLMEGLLFPHKQDVKMRVGNENFMGQLQAIRMQSYQELQGRLIGSAASYTVSRNNMTDLKNYLRHNYGRSPELNNALAAVNQKERLTNAIARDYMRLVGANVGSAQIIEALR